ncbi:cell envelope biogenesis protein OmpA [Neptunitalea chrysea]|uniref:Cell envelope biogenesis protein OmpA n=1 Tax=Neptunitalea chrysea TaxID=1647581 RepID=A0A9W6B7I1_9FLAO|nr:OmpA family protein [Neptunitalea chrysea]GLB54204.1 cell envelope biogenesis protein OmpA [Neptunitalea chrysea]
MKKLVYIFLLVLIAQGGFAQSDKTKKADKLYNQLRYVDAAEAYLKIALDDADNYVITQLANSYYYVFNTKEAARWYEKALPENKDPEIRFRYAQMLKANGKYDQANAQMHEFATADPSDSRAKEFLKNPNYIPELLAAEKKFEIKPININSALSDFGGYFHLNTFYFTSARAGGRKYGWNEEPYLNIYKAQYVTDAFTAVEELGDNINTRYHEGTVAISDDGQTMYFARTNYDDGKFVKDSMGIGLVNLFKATMVDGQWDNVERLSFNSDDYTSQHPALSDDGKTLYFASDRPGGYGASDMYKVSINEDGTYGTPENLGDQVNTEANEGFPFVNDGLLYFASNGHLGLGGLDLFVTDIKGNSFGEVRNLGVPINSNKDDFSFSFEAATKTGFFSSNRDGGKGSDDIYMATQVAPICDVDYVITVTDKETGAIIAGAKVSLADTEGNAVGTKTSDEEGKVTFKVECNKDITLETTAKDYNSDKTDVKGTDTMITNVGVALDPIEIVIAYDKVVLNPIYFDFDKHNIRKDAAFELDKLVQVMEKYPEMTIKVETHADSRGKAKYNLQLTDKRAKSTVQYLISKGISEDRLTSEGMGETKPLVDCKKGCTSEEHQKNRRSDFIITNKTE